MSTKRCRRCKTEKQLSEFQKSRKTPDGFSSICDVCKEKEKLICIESIRADAALTAHLKAQPRRMNVFAKPTYTGETPAPMRTGAMDAYKLKSKGV